MLDFVDSEKTKTGTVGTVLEAFSQTESQTENGDRIEAREAPEAESEVASVVRPHTFPDRHNEYQVARALPCLRTRPANTNSRNRTLSVLRFAPVMDASCTMVRRSCARKALIT